MQPESSCRHCHQPIRCIYQAQRGKTDCWAHIATATLFCAGGHPCVAEPPPKPTRAEREAAA